MEINFLNLNKNKTEILFGQSYLLDAYESATGPLASYWHLFARNLGVIVDCAFKFDRQISAVVKTSFFQLRLLAKIKAYLPFTRFWASNSYFVTSCLDYCISLYVGLDQSSHHCLQAVQNIAACLLIGEKRRDHITPVLASLLWVPVCFRIQFKISLLVFKSLNWTGPLYLSELLKPRTPSRALRSTNQLLLDIPRSRLKNRGDRAFSVAACKLLNSLPYQVRAAQA